MEIRSFSELTGHTDTVEFFQNSIRNDKVASSYILSGEKGCGKKTMASLFAATLLCEKEGVDPCGVCISCRKAFADSHPDIIYVTHEKPDLITVDEIREQVVETVDIRPYEGKYKVYIIDDAQKMNNQAQNALLKVIEEPPEYVVIILLATNSRMLLATIESRCIVIDIKAVPTDLLKDYLIRYNHLSENEANIIAAYANGNIGKAKRAVLSEEFMENVKRNLRLLAGFDSMSVAQCVAAALSIAKDKANISGCLDIFTLWFKDVLTFKATRDVDLLTFRGYFKEISDRANKISYEEIDDILKAIAVARTRVDANVNPGTVMELLFHTIKECS